MAGDRHSGIPPPQGRLLVVDDEALIAEAVSDYFTALGYRVDCAGDVEQACGLIGSVEYAAVITDLRLAGDRWDGMAIVRCTHDHQPWAACIVLTAYGDPRNEEEARRQGADVLIQKPAPLALVAGQLQRIWQQKETFA